MQFIDSCYEPLKIDDNFSKHFIDLMGYSDYLQLVTGYVSEESLLFLKDNLEHNKKLHCDLIIGMHLFGGFTLSQYKTASSLAKYLSKNNQGKVLLSCAYPYHGKFYNFYNKKDHFATIMGSANLTQIIPTKQRNFCLKINDKRYLKDSTSHYNNLLPHCKLLSDCNITKFIKKNDLLKDCIGVKKLGINELSHYNKSEGKLSYKLKLKPSKGSNLNISYGKGRKNKNNIIRPRSWFEFEIIVPKKTTSLTGYPYKKTFKVVTDDGWMFECKTQGDYAKNFRSTGGLAILGMWVKGKLLDSGVVSAGEFITKPMLEQFGDEYVTLASTKENDIWLLKFRGSI